jgi:diketogulonate reductase-like aldo/keto reductase
MEALVREGRARSLGVSNFGVAKMAEIEGFAEVPLSVCQVEGESLLLAAGRYLSSQRVY